MELSRARSKVTCCGTCKLPVDRVGEDRCRSRDLLYSLSPCTVACCYVYSSNSVNYYVCKLKIKWYVNKPHLMYKYLFGGYPKAKEDTNRHNDCTDTWTYWFGHVLSPRENILLCRDNNLQEWTHTHYHSILA